MKVPRPSPLSVAVLAAALVIGGAGGAIAAGQIGTHQIRNGAVTTAKIHQNAVTSAKIHSHTVKATDLSKSARGAKVVQYVASGALIGTQDTEKVQLPGTWDANKLADSSWTVELVRNGPPTYLFTLGQSAPAGEGTSDGFYVNLPGSVAYVYLNTSSFSAIDTIRIVRTISTSAATGSPSRSAHQKRHPAEH